MSMSMVVGKFKVDLNDRLDADYIELSKAIVITQYIDEVVSDYISELKVFEKVDTGTFEEVIYKTINNENLIKLAELVDSLQEEFFEKHSSANGKSAKQDIANHLKNLASINYIIRETFINYVKYKENENDIKLVIA